MHRFQDILVVFDSEEQTGPVFERAVALCEKNRARLKVVAVVEEAPERRFWSRNRPTPATLAEQICAERAEEIEAFVQAYAGGVEVQVQVFQGIPFLEIIREVMREGHDLVMKAVEPLEGWRRMIFSSTDMHLMRKCPSAVWIMKPALASQHNRILAAVDPAEDDREAEALNVRVMDLATSLADAHGSELNVVHSWTLYGESMLRGPRFKMSDEEVDTLAAEARKEHRLALRTLLARYPLQKMDSHVYLLKGLPGEVIPRFAHQHQIELIVMGTVSQSRVAGLIMSDTAENVLRQVDCSVLVVKPEGFISPVQLEDAQPAQSQEPVF